MAEARAGVVLATDINGPMATPGSSLINKSAPATWALVWFAIAALLLFVV